MGDNKGRILFLEHYLMDHADEKHPITTDALVAAMEERGYSVNRNTLRDDLAALREEGVKAAGVRVGNAKGYYIQNRPFSTAELKALIDSVSSSQFVPQRDSDALVRRLAEMAPESTREDLIATAFAADRIKTGSPVAFNALAAVYRAIRDRRQISFWYVDYLPDKEEILRHNKKKYVVSPYALLWDNGRYYVPSWDPEKEKIVAYRVDRMRNVLGLQDPADRSRPFDPADYCRKALWMYDGDAEEREVMLDAENRHMISLLDRFGADIDTAAIDEKRLRAMIRVIPSATFFSWVFQFGGEIRIAWPEQVKKDYEEMLRAVLARQEGGRK